MQAFSVFSNIETKFSLQNLKSNAVYDENVCRIVVKIQWKKKIVFNDLQNDTKYVLYLNRSMVMLDAAQERTSFLQLFSSWMNSLL